MAAGNLPIFAVGSYSKIQPAISEGILTYPSYVFITDTDQFAFIDKNLDIRIIVGEWKKQIIRVDELPSAEYGDTEALYICDDIVYLFTGTGYKPVYLDFTDEINELNVKARDLESKITALEESVANIIDGSSGLVFSKYDDFPDIGVANQLYIDESDETGGIYTYSIEKGTYVKLASSENTTGVKFIEL